MATVEIFNLIAVLITGVLVIMVWLALYFTYILPKLENINAYDRSLVQNLHFLASITIAFVGVLVLAVLTIAGFARIGWI